MKAKQTWMQKYLDLESQVCNAISKEMKRIDRTVTSEESTFFEFDKAVKCDIIKVTITGLLVNEKNDVLSPGDYIESGDLDITDVICLLQDLQEIKTPKKKS